MAQHAGFAAPGILHTATMVLAIVTLAALGALACILVTWATAVIVRRRRAHQQAILRSVKSDTQSGLVAIADLNNSAPELSTRLPSPHTWAAQLAALSQPAPCWSPARLGPSGGRWSRRWWPLAIKYGP
jgi:hypothetical protein